MNTNKLREEAVKWFNELPIESKERLFSEYKKWTPATTHQQLTGREIEYIWVKEIVTPWWDSLTNSQRNGLANLYDGETREQIIAYCYIEEHTEKEEIPLPKTVEEAANDYISKGNNRQREYGMVMGAIKFGAAWQKEQDKVIISELLGALKIGRNIIEKTTLGFNEEERQINIAISKAETYLNQK